MSSSDTASSSGTISKREPDRFVQLGESESHKSTHVHDTRNYPPSTMAIDAENQLTVGMWCGRRCQSKLGSVRIRKKGA